MTENNMTQETSAQSDPERPEGSEDPERSESPERSEGPEDDGDTGDKGKDGKNGFLLFLRDIAIIFVIALVVSFLIKTFLIRSFFIPSASMEDTLQIDDRIIVNELVPSLIPVEHGDVVVFRDPGGWLPSKPPQPPQNPIAAGSEWILSLVGLAAPDSNDHLVKRVIGLPGDHVSCCNVAGQMSVNGVPLDESAYATLPLGVTRVSADNFDVVVPAASLWVMGDNRYNSKDSRYNGNTPTHGFVPIPNVVGRAFVVSWPISHWAWLDNYPGIFRGVEPAK